MGSVWLVELDKEESSTDESIDELSVLLVSSSSSEEERMDELIVEVELPSVYPENVVPDSKEDISLKLLLLLLEVSLLEDELSPQRFA